jgi:hypothetical protein
MFGTHESFVYFLLPVRRVGDGRVVEVVVFESFYSELYFGPGNWGKTPRETPLWALVQQLSVRYHARTILRCFRVVRGCDREEVTSAYIGVEV